MANRESIWRRSYLADHYIFDLDTRKRNPFTKVVGRQSVVELSPQGRWAGVTTFQ